MSFADSEGPPAKKRRFFTEKSDVLDSSLAHEASLPDELDAFPSSAQDGENVSKHTSTGSGSQSQRPPLNGRSQNDAPLGFDQDTFESFVGDKVAPDVMRKLREASGDHMERAVNMFFDGSWKTASTSKFSTSLPMTLNGFARTNSNGEGSSKKSPRTGSPAPKVQLRDSMPEFRYIGVFGVGGWATRSGTTLIKHGEPIRIERQKIQPPKAPVGKGKGRPALNAPKPNSAAAKRVDVIVRFTNARGDEIGRLPRDHANWVSTLIDQKVCKFEGTCIYAPERIRTNDTIFIQLRCTLLRTAFDTGGFKLPDNRTAGLFEEKETSEEKELRLRQVALVKLFEEINMLPSRTSETTAKHKREGLLQAAEVAEQYEAQKKKADASENGGSSPLSEEEEGKELEQDQLDSLYKKAQSFDFNAPAAEPADTFAMDLRQYQKQALHWMMAKEKDEKDESKEMSMHPLWEEYAWPLKDNDEKELPQVIGQDRFYVNLYSGELSLKFPLQEQHCLGGILADEMGLGKTIEMMSLIHSHKSEIAMRVEKTNTTVTSVNSLPRLPANTANVEYAPCTTLVVAPMSLLAQWQSEAENASKEGTMKAMVYYGSEKTANLQALCCEANAASAPNVIITSYGVILSEFNQVAAKNGGRGSHGGLFSLKYFRVILDEAHHIKNRQSKTAKACYEIDAEHRWVLTGTPIVNRLEDLFSLVKFLRVEPWSNFSFWKTFITMPFESKDFMRALDVVQTVLEPLVLRRTKDMKTPTGEALVPLPPKTIDIVDIEMSKPEREVYDHIFTRAKRTFAANVEAGTVLKAYTSIFAQILRLRQACCHPILTRNQNLVADELEAAELADASTGLADDMDLQSLIERFTAATDDSADANAFGAHVLEQIRDEADNECPICSEEPMIEQTVTGCWHSACKKCLLDYITHQTDKGEVPKCFNCREVLNTRDIFEVVKDEGHPDSSDGKPKISLQRLGSNSSAKIGALLTHLKTLRKELPGTKSVVFSQFTSFLSLIEPALTRASIPFMRLDGSMAQKDRAAVLREFAASNKGIVLLLSLRAGGVGLNLTMAKRVYMMDPWWSFAVEAQAIDRVHRMGQVDEVKVCRFIVKESVEERMLKIQDRKKFIASSLGMMSDEEKKLQRIEDIKELLS
ncbi:putative DNA repair protein rad-5 [Acephala macrosclerotiorum]|nr:putative DNA repair protein rad-5 [Acephala macrosclerotiorum]